MKTETFTPFGPFPVSYRKTAKTLTFDEDALWDSAQLKDLADFTGCSASRSSHQPHPLTSAAIARQGR